MKSHYDVETRRFVSAYFHLINEKDMQGLLNMFTDDCVIYEPFGKGPQSHNTTTEKTCLKGKSEVESFLNVVMMASNGLRYQIKFMDDPNHLDTVRPSDIFGYTSTSIVSVLATFYANNEGHELRERLTFHVVSRKNYDNSNMLNSDFNTNRKEIKTLWIQFCPPESTK